MEPALSLDYNEAVASRQSEETSKEMLKLIIDLQRQVAEMRRVNKPPQALKVLLQPSEG